MLYNAVFVYLYLYGLWPEIKSYYYYIIIIKVHTHMVVFNNLFEPKVRVQPKKRKINYLLFIYNVISSEW